MLRQLRSSPTVPHAAPTAPPVLPQLMKSKGKVAAGDLVVVVSDVVVRPAGLDSPAGVDAGLAPPRQGSSGSEHIRSVQVRHVP